MVAKWARGYSGLFGAFQAAKLFEDFGQRFRLFNRQPLWRLAACVIAGNSIVVVQVDAVRVVR